MALTQKWLEAMAEIDYAFQPLINPVTGITCAVEALIRGVERTEFISIENFFDTAFREQVLFELDLLLRHRAISKFLRIDFCQKIKLFYNYDLRILKMPDHQYGVTEEILAKYNLTPDTICFELSERHHVETSQKLKEMVTVFRNRGFQLALDDFGAGFASLELFYHSEPDVLKCDRFLISTINRDLRKKIFFSSIVNTAKLLGVLVVAEGVETEEEFQTCRELGCDLVQGYYLQKPTLNIAELSYLNTKVNRCKKLKVLKSNHEAEMLAREIIWLEPIKACDNLKVLFEKFHINLEYSFFPVIDKTGYPLGIIHEKSIKKYVYSPYGKDLLFNRSIRTSMATFISKCPTVDLNTPQEKILTIYSSNPNAEGIIITKSQKYYGFLTAKALLKLINQKNLDYAREVNPLTSLPGNILINQYLSETYQETQDTFYYIYYDFNDFKPFNDYFGFSLGDQAIGLFAEILKQKYMGRNEFIGHIGGDDFFVGINAGKTSALEAEKRRAQAVIDCFTLKTAGLYEPQIRHNGFYYAKDRDGNERKIDLLSTCAAILEVLPNERHFSLKEISVKLSEVKKNAKMARINRVVAAQL